MLLGALELRDVRIGRDVAAVGHWLAADLVRRARCAARAGSRTPCGPHVREPLADLFPPGPCRRFAALGVPPDDVGDRSADVNEFVGIVEHLDVAAVPRNDARLGVRTAMPCDTFSIVACSSWRLKRSSCEVSSSSSATSSAAMPRPPSACVNINRADEAPIAPASTRSMRLQQAAVRGLGWRAGSGARLRAVLAQRTFGRFPGRGCAPVTASRSPTRARPRRHARVP